MTKFYITKYALTEGVFSVDGERCSDNFVSYRRHGFTQYAHGKDFHEDEQMALADAERRRVNKIAAIKKSLLKLEKMTFKVTA